MADEVYGYVTLRYRACGRGRRLRIEGVWPEPSWWHEYADTPTGIDAAEYRLSRETDGRHIIGVNMTPRGPITKVEARTSLFGEPYRFERPPFVSLVAASKHDSEDEQGED